MVPDPNHTSLGLEYFCNEGDITWNMSDEALIEQGKREIAQIGIAAYEDVIDGCVFRVENTYPVYDEDYETYLDTIKTYVASLENFQTIGRNGLHRYNNQDHAMLTGIFAVRNLLFNEKNNLWQVNAEQEYLETVTTTRGRDRRRLLPSFSRLPRRTIPVMDDVAKGLSLGFILGLVTYFLTLFLV